MRTSLVLLLALTPLGSTACGGLLDGGDVTDEQSSALRGDPMLPLPLPPTANPVPVGRLEKPPVRVPGEVIPPAVTPPASLYGTITSYAGFPGQTDHSDGPVQTSFGHPTWIASTPAGLTWVVDLDDELDVYADQYKSRIRLIRDTRSGAAGPHVQTILVQTDYTIDVNGIGGMAVDPATGDLFVSQTRYHTINKITTAGAVSLIAGFNAYGATWGTLQAAYYADSPLDSLGVAHPFQARFNGPAGLARDAQGNLFVADTNNHAIRKITPAGVVSTVARDTSASPLAPSSLAVDGRDGSLYTTSGHAVYHVLPGASAATGQIVLHAGNPTTGGYSDTIATSSLFNEPKGLAVDRSGNVYVADKGTAHIRKIVPSNGSVSSVAMVETVSFHPYSYQPTFDGYGPDDDTFLGAPWGLSFWNDALVMSDAARGTVRVLH